VFFFVSFSLSNLFINLIAKESGTLQIANFRKISTTFTTGILLSDNLCSNCPNITFNLSVAGRLLQKLINYTILLARSKSTNKLFSLTLLLITSIDNHNGRHPT